MSRFLVALALLVASITIVIPYSHGIREIHGNNKIKTSIYLSPRVDLKPGSVADKYIYNIDFPTGHIGLKSFNAEVVDELGRPVPLHETYLHHWVVGRYYQHKNASNEPDGPHNFDGPHNLNKASDYIFVRNDGICQGHSLGQFYGLGSETRKTATYVPDPYGIEVGNPNDIPSGYEHRWMLNIHAIDTRGVEERLGCTECRCDLYNVTVDAHDQPLNPDYIGGLRCCYDQTQCRTKAGIEDVKRAIYLRYTVKWVEWDESILPVKVYILDVTDTWKAPNRGSTEAASEHNCLVEYQVESCNNNPVTGTNGCKDSKRAQAALPTGGYLIYGVAHQHTGGIAATLYGEDGRELCSSISVYGEGKEAGNEAGYIVGMSTCYPRPGSVKINDGEVLTLESIYSSTQRHTGVMGLFYIMVAEQLPKSSLSLEAQALSWELQ